MNMYVKVLYEDNHLIAVLKPAGFLVQKDSSDSESLMEIVKKYLKEKYKKPGNVFLGLLHRLDRNVSGIVLFAKTSKGAARLSEQFRNREVQKLYHAVVVGKIDDKRGYLRDFIRKDESSKKALTSDVPGDDFSEVELWYETISKNEKFSLLKVEIKSGKFHQIRAQLANAGYPIAGDIKYGAGNPLRDNSIALCATEIKFKTVTSEEVKKISVEYPQWWRQEFAI